MFVNELSYLPGQLRVHFVRQVKQVRLAAVTEMIAELTTTRSETIIIANN
jgi:hypothetical protein